LDAVRLERFEPRNLQIDLAAKIAFLGCAGAYSPRPGRVAAKETHMSWVFIADELVYKLKKPVRFPYLDFSTIERREAACRAELDVNRRLAPTVYIDVVPLTAGRGGLMIGGQGAAIDWLVMMRRLADDNMLDRLLAGGGGINPGKVDELANVLSDFYRHAERPMLSPAVHLGEWRRKLQDNRSVLFDTRFQLDYGVLALVDRAQRRFVTERGREIAARVRSRRIVDGHGDLKPEHVSLASPLAIIDRLEFNPRFRICDPFEELASLSVECELAGASWIGDRLCSRIAWAIGDRVSPELFDFYRCYRATLRARLTIAHLLDPDTRTPERWPGLARRYLAIAARDAHKIEVADGLRRRCPQHRERTNWISRACSCAR
jgi:aminoglycoside phosphotransferase family enzyme